MLKSWNDTEFEKRLANAFGSEEIAGTMVELHGRYFCARGIIADKNAFSHYFGSPTQAREFVEKHAVELAPVYDPDEFEGILMSELSITSDQARKFTELEESYAVELGLM